MILQMGSWCSLPIRISSREAEFLGSAVAGRTGGFEDGLAPRVDVAAQSKSSPNPEVEEGLVPICDIECGWR